MTLNPQAFVLSAVFGTVAGFGSNYLISFIGSRYEEILKATTIPQSRDFGVLEDLSGDLRSGLQKWVRLRRLSPFISFVVALFVFAGTYISSSSAFASTGSIGSKNERPIVVRFDQRRAILFRLLETTEEKRIEAFRLFLEELSKSERVGVQDDLVVVSYTVPVEEYWKFDFYTHWTSFGGDRVRLENWIAYNGHGENSSEIARDKVFEWLQTNAVAVTRQTNLTNRIKVL